MELLDRRAVCPATGGRQPGWSLPSIRWEPRRPQLQRSAKPAESTLKQTGGRQAGDRKDAAWLSVEAYSQLDYPETAKYPGVAKPGLDARRQHPLAPALRPTGRRRPARG